MLFGLPSAFAIEAMSERDLKIPSAVWGRMRVWCQGTAIGDFSDEYCGLSDTYDGFKSLESSLPNLWRQEFSGLSVVEIWRLLDARLYGNDGTTEIEDDRTIEECRRDWDEYGQFNFLTNWGEQFDDGGKSFILCPPEGDVLILNQSLPAQYGIALRAPLLTFKAAVRDFTRWFEVETLRLSGKAAT